MRNVDPGHFSRRVGDRPYGSDEVRPGRTSENLNDSGGGSGNLALPETGLRRNKRRPLWRGRCPSLRLPRSSFLQVGPVALVVVRFGGEAISSGTVTALEFQSSLCRALCCAGRRRLFQLGFRGCGIEFAAWRRDLFFSECGPYRVKIKMRADFVGPSARSRSDLCGGRCLPGDSRFFFLSSYSALD